MVAKAAPKENDGAAAGVAVDPKEGAEETEVTAPKVGTGAVVALAGVEPNVNNPGVAAAVVAEAAEGAAPKVKGLTEATVNAVVVRAGRCLKFFIGGCFVKVGFCNISKVGFLSRWVFVTF